MARKSRAELLGLPDDGQCTANTRAGARCRAPSLIGVQVCRMHGGALPKVAAKSAREKQRRELELLSKSTGIRPIDKNDPEARGDVALAVEIRRTVAWIRFCEDQIERAGGDVPQAPDALADVMSTLKLSKRETVSGYERGEAVSTKSEVWSAGIDVWEERLRWNRSHLTGLTKQWINAGFEARRLELASRTLDVLEKAIDGIVRDLGHNPRDIAVRQIVSNRLREATTHEGSDDGE